MDSVLVDPLAPEQLHLHFAQAARAAASDIKNFSQTMEDPRNTVVLEKAKESRAKNTDDITNWLVTEHQDWLDVKDENLDDVVAEEIREGETSSSTGMKSEDIVPVLERFKNTHPDIEASMEEGSTTIKVRQELSRTFLDIVLTMLDVSTKASQHQFRNPDYFDSRRPRRLHC